MSDRTLEMNRPHGYQTHLAERDRATRDAVEAGTLTLCENCREYFPNRETLQWVEPHTRETKDLCFADFKDEWYSILPEVQENPRTWAAFFTFPAVEGD